MTSFKLSQVQFSYDADFFPPILEIASPSQQVPFMKRLLGNFGLKLGEVILAPQNLSRNMISFRKWTPNDSSYEITLGTDGLTINCYNPTSAENAWEPATKAMEAIRHSTEFTFDRQVLKFQGHCTPEAVRAREYIARYNTFTADPGLLSSKGLTFTFTGPTSNAQTFLVLNESALVADGLYVFSETTYMGPSDAPVNLFAACVDFLTGVVFPVLELEFAIGVQK